MIVFIVGTNEASICACQEEKVASGCTFAFVVDFASSCPGGRSDLDLPGAPEIVPAYGK